MITIEKGRRVRTQAGQVGTVADVCEEFVYVRYDQPLFTVQGMVVGVWALATSVLAINVTIIEG